MYRPSILLCSSLLLLACGPEGDAVTPSSAGSDATPTSQLPTATLGNTTASQGDPSETPALGTETQSDTSTQSPVVKEPVIVRVVRSGLSLPVVGVTVLTGWDLDGVYATSADGVVELVEHDPSVPITVAWRFAYRPSSSDAERDVTMSRSFLGVKPGETLEVSYVDWGDNFDERIDAEVVVTGTSGREEDQILMVRTRSPRVSYTYSTYNIDTPQLMTVGASSTTDPYLYSTLSDAESYLDFGSLARPNLMGLTAHLDDSLTAADLLVGFDTVVTVEDSGADKTMVANFHDYSIRMPGREPIFFTENFREFDGEPSTLRLPSSMDLFGNDSSLRLRSVAESGEGGEVGSYQTSSKGFSTLVDSLTVEYKPLISYSVDNEALRAGDPQGQEVRVFLNQDSASDFASFATYQEHNSGDLRRYFYWRVTDLSGKGEFRFPTLPNDLTVTQVPDSNSGSLYGSFLVESCWGDAQEWRLYLLGGLELYPAEIQCSGHYLDISESSGNRNSADAGRVPGQFRSAMRAKSMDRYSVLSQEPISFP